MSYIIPSLIGNLSNPEMGRRIMQALGNFLLGHINTNTVQANGSTSFTFTANTGASTITFSPGVLSETSQLILIPKTANAATANNTWYISARSVSANTMTITHANNAQTDRTFGYVLIG